MPKKVVVLLVLKFQGRGDVEYLVEMTEDEFASLTDRLSKPISYPILIAKCIQSGMFGFSNIVFSRDSLSFLTAFHHDATHP